MICLFIRNTLTVLSICLLTLSVSSFHIKVDKTSRQLYDTSDNRVRIFHGVNVVHKLHPYHPTLTGEFHMNNSLLPLDMKILAKLGMNVVRLGVMWPGVEPSYNEFNQTYLNVMKELVINLGNHGIATIIDFHQDLLHGSFCGEGVPDYIISMLGNLNTKCYGVSGFLYHLLGACNSFEFDYKFDLDVETGFPMLDQCLERVFATYYSSPEVNSAFDRLYTRPDVQDRLALYFEKVAETFFDVESVLGYDLLNEPWPGDVFTKPWLIQGGKADFFHLQPLYEKLHLSIRKYDLEKIVFYEPVQFPGTLPIFGGVVSPVGFTQSPGGQAFDDKNVLSYHIYCCASGFKHCNHTTGDVNEMYNDICDDYVEKKYSQRVADYTRIGGGGFLTEFGACSNSQTCIDEIQRIAHESDKYFDSWAYWQFKFNDDITTQSGVKQGFFHTNGTLQREKLIALTRPYAKAIGGKPIEMVYSPTTRVFVLEFKPFDIEQIIAPSSAETILHLHSEWLYPFGFFANINGIPTNLIQKEGHASAVNEWIVPPMEKQMHDKSSNMRVTIYPEDTHTFGVTDGIQWVKVPTLPSDFQTMTTLRFVNLNRTKHVRVLDASKTVICDATLTSVESYECVPMALSTLMYDYTIQISSKVQKHDTLSSYTEIATMSLKSMLFPASRFRKTKTSLFTPTDLFNLYGHVVTFTMKS